MAGSGGGGGVTGRGISRCSIGYLYKLYVVIQIYTV